MNICVFCEYSLDDGQEVVTLGTKDAKALHRLAKHGEAASLPCQVKECIRNAVIDTATKGEE